ncbi:MAG TPA: hypothetical protein PKJ90_10625, partial [Bacteroidia bacterium]|nr:hypothetical protein [Bacteroidia bacterium]
RSLHLLLLLFAFLFDFIQAANILHIHNHFSAKLHHLLHYNCFVIQYFKMNCRLTTQHNVKNIFLFNPFNGLIDGLL